MKQESPIPFFFAGEQISGFQLIRPLRVRDCSECWYALNRENRTPVAVKFLRPEHPRIADAQLSKAAALTGLGRKSQAQSVLREIIKKYPKTSFAELAQKRLEALNPKKK